MDFREFCVLMARVLNNIDHEEEIREAYRCFSKNPQGLIPDQEIRQTLQYIIRSDVYNTNSMEEPLREQGIVNLIRLSLSHTQHTFCLFPYHLSALFIALCIDLDEIMQYCDSDHDGCINFQEFLAIMTPANSNTHKSRSNSSYSKP